MSKSPPNPSQELKQGVCQKYGWSLHYERKELGPQRQDDDEAARHQEPVNDRHQQFYWNCSVVISMNESRTFTWKDPVTTAFPTQKEIKEAKNAVSAVALQGLANDLARLATKRTVCNLAQAFPNKEDIPIYESTEENWKYFWQHKPVAVGIDVEGNQRTPVPVLVQIATRDYCILEAPRTRLSKHLKRLLSDDSICKVFCDNFAQKDKKSLGILTNLQLDDASPFYLEQAFSSLGNPVVDVESLASKLLGPVSTPRGLGRLVTLTMPELDVLVQKPSNSRRRKDTKNMKGGRGKHGQGSGARLADVARFCWIEQGKAPQMKSIWELTHEEQQYAAFDAWCTLLVYERLAAAVLGHQVAAP